MAAYIVFIRDEPIHDPAEMAEYQRLNRERGSGGFDVKRLAFYGAVEALEGTTPDGVVILEFPDAEEARRWYGSPGYQEALQHRLKAASYRVLLVEGCEGSLCTGMKMKCQIADAERLQFGQMVPSQLRRRHATDRYPRRSRANVNEL